jgi:hypothetical protein
MKQIIALFLFGMIIYQAKAQTDTTSNRILTKEETAEFFTPAFKKKNLINFSIFRAYTYSDKSGKYYVALTESADTVNKEKDTVNFTIKAFNFKVDKALTLKKWEINDFRTPAVKGVDTESSIWFWTKYCQFNDIDGDGLVDPIVVYGTFGTEGYSDGRAKILIYYKGQKVAIRHQNNPVEAKRKTTIDLLFYTLPPKMQEKAKEIMAKMITNNHAMFANGYVEKMDKKATSIVN